MKTTYRPDKMSLAPYQLGPCADALKELDHLRSTVDLIGDNVLKAIFYIGDGSLVTLNEYDSRKAARALELIMRDRMEAIRKEWSGYVDLEV